jgi:hypothetical protein
MTIPPMELEALAQAEAHHQRASVRHGDEAVEFAERAVEIATWLARQDGVGYLHTLARMTHGLGRSYRQARRFDRAAAAFEQAVAGYRILAEDQPHTHRGTLIEVMSDHALALAQVGELERAHAVALTALELAEHESGWGLLPLIIGTRQLAADLDLDLGRPRDAFEQLVAGMRLLNQAIDERQPGAVEAATRLGASLRELCEGQGLALPEGLLERAGAGEVGR